MGKLVMVLKEKICRAHCKLNSRNGETLLETLISLLVASMSLIILAGAIVASGKVNDSVNKGIFSTSEATVKDATGVTMYIENDGGTSLKIEYPSDGAATYASTEIKIYEVTKKRGATGEKEQKYYYWSAMFSDDAAAGSGD